MWICTFYEIKHSRMRVQAQDHENYSVFHSFLFSCLRISQHSVLVFPSLNSLLTSHRPLQQMLNVNGKSASDLIENCKLKALTPYWKAHSHPWPQSMRCTAPCVVTFDLYLHKELQEINATRPPEFFRYTHSILYCMCLCVTVVLYFIKMRSTMTKQFLLQT